MQENVWPPKEGISTPTVSAAESVLALTGSAHINAPASFVFNILLDTATYPEWCSFVPRVVIDEQPSSSTHDLSTEATSKPAVLIPGTRFCHNTRFTFYAVMGGHGSKQTPTHLIISDLSTPSVPSSYISQSHLEASSVFTADLSSVYRVAWKGDKVDFFAKGLNTERFHEIIIRDREQCEVRTWEAMGGVLAHTVKWLYRKTLERKFDEWCAELKAFSEEKWTRQQAGC